MVKLKYIMQDSPMTRKALCSLYATTKEDLEGDFEIEGLPSDYKADIGSECITGAFEIFQLTEDGWVEYK